MSSRRVSVSSVLDRLEAWGEPPVVNPVRHADPSPPTGEASPGPGRFVGLMACAFVALAAILFVWFVNTAGVAGFIYAQF